MINFNHLYYFYMAVREGGLSAASRKLRISQPAMSKQIKILEEQLEHKLFKKSGRKLQLTSIGKKIFIKSQEIFELGHQITRDLHLTEREEEKGHLKLGISDEIERPFIVSLAEKILRNQKIGSLIITSNDHRTSIEALRDYSLDAVLTNQIHPTVDTMLIGSFDMPVVFGIGRRYLEKNSLHLKKDQDVPQLLREANIPLCLPNPRLKLRGEIESWLSRYKAKQRVIFETDFISALIRAVIIGIGGGFFPLPYIKSEIENGDIIPVRLKRAEWTHHLFMISRKSFEGSELRQSLQTAFQKFLAENQIKRAS